MTSVFASEIQFVSGTGGWINGLTSLLESGLFYALERKKG